MRYGIQVVTANSITFDRWKLKDERLKSTARPLWITVMESTWFRYNDKVKQQISVLKTKPHRNLLVCLGSQMDKQGKVTRVAMEQCTTDLPQMRQMRKFSKQEVSAIVGEVLVGLDHLRNFGISRR